MAIGFNTDPEAHKDAFANALIVLATNILKRWRFNGVEKSDAIQECVLLALSKSHRYDPTRGKAFNFFTTLLLNHCRQLYRKSKGHAATLLRFKEVEMRRQRNNLRHKD